MKKRTLVITAGQLRGGEFTWERFNEFVLKTLDADLAVCVRLDDFFDPLNPFYINAKYRWLSPSHDDMAIAYDTVKKQIGSEEDWRQIFEIDGIWLGGIKEANRASISTLSYYYRWLILDSLRSGGLLDVYDRFVITRSDFFFLSPHPPVEILDPHYVWMPNGENYGGLTERHHVLSRENVIDACNLLEVMITRPADMVKMLKGREWNGEAVYLQHFIGNGLIDKVKRFPFFMFLAKTSNDPTSWGVPFYKDGFSAGIKYKGEYEVAQFFSGMIKEVDDWRHFFRIEAIIGPSHDGLERSINWLTENLSATGYQHSMEPLYNALDWLKFFFNETRAPGALAPFLDQEISNLIIFGLRNIAKSRAKFLQDIWVLHELRGMRDGYYVDIGAGDGVTWSNTFLLANSYGWNGIMVEAHPDLHDRIPAARLEPRVLACVMGRSGEEVLFRLEEDPYAARVIGNDSPLTRDVSGPGQNILVKTTSLNDLLMEVDAPACIDLLSIDVNGYEHDILSNFDFGKYHIRTLCVAHDSGEKQQAVLDCLTANGFVRRFSELSKGSDWYVPRSKPHR